MALGDALDLGVGTSGQVAQSNGTTITLSTATYPLTTTINQILFSSAANVIGGISTANGGVLTTDNTGLPQILAGSGTTGTVIQAVSGNKPIWSTATYPSTTTINQILYSGSTNVVNGLPTSNNGVLNTTNTGAPQITSTLPTAVQSNITQVGTITAGIWNGSLIAPANGGSGVASPTAHGILVAEGASAFNPITLTNGQLLVGSTGVDPVAAALTAGTGISVTNGAGSITVGLSTPVSLANGGTNAILTAANGAIPYSTASAIALLAAGTSGQLIQSGGVGAPNWTTATYPSTASTSGNILTSNGTNFTSSAPFLPANQVFVAKNGNDSTGNGSVLNPFLTIAHALSTITTASSGNRYAIIIQSGQYDESTLAIKPYVSLWGAGYNNTRITVTGNQVTLDGGFSGTTSRSGFFNLIFTGTTGLQFDLSGLAAGSAVFDIWNTWINGPVNIIGRSAGNDFVQSFLSSYFGAVTYSSMQITSVSDVYNSTYTVNSAGTNGNSAGESQGDQFLAAVSISNTGANTTTYTISGTYLASTLAVSGANTTVNVESSIKPVPTISNSATVSVIGTLGTNTNNNATTGKVGEYISSSVLVGSAVSLTSGTSANITSISLTAGDWDVRGVVWSNPSAGTTSTSFYAGINTTSATLPTAGAENNQSGVQFLSVANSVTGVPVGSTRISVATTTTVYLIANFTFAVSTMSGYGFIGARRVR